MPLSAPQRERSRSDPAFPTSIAGTAPCIGRPEGRRKPFAARVRRRSIDRWTGDRAMGRAPEGVAQRPAGSFGTTSDETSSHEVPFQRRIDSRNALGQQCGSPASEDGLADPEVTARDRDLGVARVAAEDLARVAYGGGDDPVRPAGTAAPDVLEAQDVGDRVTRQLAGVDADPEHTEAHRIREGVHGVPALVLGSLPHDEPVPPTERAAVQPGQRRSARSGLGGRSGSRSSLRRVRAG